MRLAYQTNAWGGVVGHPAGVTSVKDLTYVTPGSMEVALREIAAAGYAGCEMFDGNVVGQEGRLQSLLEETGLALVAVYAGGNLIYGEILDDELWRIERAAAAGAALGAEHLVVGGGARRASGLRAGDRRLLAAGLDRVAEVAARHGLTPSYHPHLGTIVEGPEELAEVMALTPIGLCPDTAHLAAGGCDPAAVIRQHPGRVPYVHLKDLRRADTSFHPLGEGELDMDDIWAALREVGYDGWVTVEVDGHPGPERAAAEASLAWLRQRVPAEAR